jgi:hypothetical protein
LRITSSIFLLLVSYYENSTVSLAVLLYCEFRCFATSFFNNFQCCCIQSFKALRSKTGSSAPAYGSEEVDFLSSIPRVPGRKAAFTLGYPLVAPTVLSIIVMRAVAETLNQRMPATADLQPAPTALGYSNWGTALNSGHVPSGRAKTAPLEAVLPKLTEVAIAAVHFRS